VKLAALFPAALFGAGEKKIRKKGSFPYSK